MSKEDERPYRIAETNTFGKPDWFDFVAKEYEACRESVGLCDYSSFTKIDLTVSFVLLICHSMCLDLPQEVNVIFVFTQRTSQTNRSLYQINSYNYSVLSQIC